MTEHRKVRLLLYDFLRSELDGGGMRLVAGHLDRCGRCSREADELRALFTLFPPPAGQPSDTLPESYWNGFVAGVERRVSGIEADAAPGIRDRVIGSFRDLFIFRRPALIGGLAVVAVAAALLFQRGGGPGGVTGKSGGQADSGPPIAKGVESVSPDAGISGGDSVTAFDLRVQNYFRRSRTLLVGMSNANPGGGGLYDLAAEKTASRSLLNEARYLKTGPVDRGSWRLMEDLDEIMIVLANVDERGAASSAEMLRDGIRNRNLLFKLRMRDAGGSGTPFQQAVYKK
jgi:hypothetical protein